MKKGQSGSSRSNHRLPTTGPTTSGTNTGTFCDELFFAVPPDLPQDILPQDTGLIVADPYGAEILKRPDVQSLAAARRKAVTLRFARAAAQRLQTFYDPKLAGLIGKGS